MPPSSGFGRSRFGHGPFGEADYAHNTFWLGVPALYRDNDPDGLFETLLRGYGAIADRLRHKIRDLPLNRDPLHIRTRYNEVVSIVITGSVVTLAEDSEDGQAYITFEVSVPTLPNMDPVGPGWIMEAAERNYFVRSVAKVDGVFTVFGDDVPGASAQTLRPPSLIQHLGHDFGLEIDGHEPEGFQRSLVSEVVKWYNLKGTEKGIRLRADLAGFEATVRRLYRIDDGYVPLIPVANLFELATDEFYTDIEPGFVLFDDIPADIVPADTLCSITPVTFPITVTLVTVVGDQFRLTVSTALTMIANEDSDHWKVTLGADEFYVESIDLSGGFLYVAGSITPVAGAYTLEYDCPEVVTCGWCPTYKVLLDLVPTDPDLLSSPTALDGAFDRLIVKIDEILPAHVQVVYTLVTEEETFIAVEVDGPSETYVFDSYDDIPADMIPTDTPTTIIPA